MARYAYSGKSEICSVKIQKIHQRLFIDPVIKVLEWKLSGAGQHLKIPLLEIKTGEGGI